MKIIEKVLKWRVSRVSKLTLTKKDYLTKKYQSWSTNNDSKINVIHLGFLLTIEIFVRHGDFTNILRFSRHVHVRSRRTQKSEEL